MLFGDARVRMYETNVGTGVGVGTLTTSFDQYHQLLFLVRLQNADTSTVRVGVYRNLIYCGANSPHLYGGYILWRKYDKLDLDTPVDKNVTESLDRVFDY